MNFKKALHFSIISVLLLCAIIFTAACNQGDDLQLLSEIEALAPAQPNGFTGSEQYRTVLSSVIHDNEYFYEDGWWYTMWTNTSEVRRSNNLLTWETVGNRTGLGWAPYIIKLPVGPGGAERYVVYDSMSDFGTANSTMQRWVSETLITGYEREEGREYILMSGLGAHRDHPNYKVNADSGHLTTREMQGLPRGNGSVAAVGNEPNAIDPSFVWDKDGGLWMTWGSWGPGIHIIQVDPATGLLFDQSDPLIKEDPHKSYPGVRIAWRNNNVNQALEGANIIYNPDTGYYYLSLATDSLEHTYHTRIGRSENVYGPYLDYNGNDISNHQFGSADYFHIGTTILHPYHFGDDVGWTSTAHGSFFYDERTNEYFFGFNMRPGLGGTVVQGMRKIYWTDDGWPMTIPAYYTGLDNPNPERQGQDIPSHLAAGNYEVLRHTRHPRPTDAAGARISSEQITLSSNGKVTGAYEGTWTQPRGDKLELVLSHGDKELKYDLYFVASWDYENWVPTIYFTGFSEPQAGGTASADNGVMLAGKRVRS